MHYLTLTLLVLSVAVQAATVADIELEHYPPFELYQEDSKSQIGRHLLPLGALEMVHHELVPEKSETVTGYRSSRTYYLPDARRTRDVADFYEDQLNVLGEVLYTCKGRTCGSSFYWANTIFGKQVLYGPEQHQYYYIIRLESGDYLKFYIGQRGTGKIYVHMEVITLRRD